GCLKKEQMVVSAIASTPHIYGAASSTFELINAAPAEVYSYSYESSRGDAVNVVTENSQMVVNHGVGFSVQITVK
ncbi:hypothetical protein IAI16_23915, partial [Escherichia coli]|nr:hypothetical protein [Escherichia coli]MBC8843123.1 hypothetical protein [Escherichia coli]